jgi:hypothetical protein
VYLQKVVERIAGKPLNEFITEKVFNPLGMDNSSYTWRDDFDQKAAAPHDGFGNSLPKNKPDKVNAAASLHTTAPDYAAFIIALLNGTGLKKQSLTTMFTPQVQVPEKRTNPSGSLSKSVSWGLGVGLQQTSDGKAFWHWGDNYSFRCYVVAYPRGKTGVVYFTNSNNGLSVAKKITQLATGKEQPAIDFIEYEQYTEPAFKFRKNILTQGVEKAIEPFLDAKKESPIKESEMNGIGYQLLRTKKFKEGKEVFLLNMQAYPQSANVYDSYAYACLLNGEIDTAVYYYSKAYALDAKNQEAKKMIDVLTAAPNQNGNTELKLKGYANARLISLAGNFNQWHPYRNFFIKKDGEWICRLNLTPGKYQYKIVVDGDWMLDPNNQEIAEEKGNMNSLLVVK